MTSDCPKCYNWVQLQVDAVRQQLLTLSEIVTYVMTRPPQQINDTDYIDELQAVNETVHQLWYNASLHGMMWRFTACSCCMQCLSVYVYYLLTFVADTCR